jgi:23S rRNA (adenine2503-C2)-methyltransferase
VEKAPELTFSPANLLLGAGARKAHILDPDARVADWLTSIGQPAWRAKSIRRWLQGGRVESFADMTDLPKGLRLALEETFSIWSASVAKHNRAEDGTEKLLLRLHDGQHIECVLLRDGLRRTVCISS